MNSISGVSSLISKTDNILADLTKISGNASNIANVAIIIVAFNHHWL